MTLDEYLKKRDFTKTPEPLGEEDGVHKNALRFVVHKHRASHLHWDLRLELDGVLKSWAIPKGPSLDPNEKKLAVMVEDHPLEYQYFEGVIPEGSYGAGEVMIWDRGTYHASGYTDREQSDSALRRGLGKGHLSFVLEGEKLGGEFTLVRLKTGKGADWLLMKKEDSLATRDLRFPETSVSSGRTMDQIEQNSPEMNHIDLSGASIGVMPVDVRPMLATPVSAPFDSPGWFFEIKWDGYRCLSEIKDGKVHLYSRNGKNLDSVFAPLLSSLGSLPFEALIDGEVVVIDEIGRADFQMLQNYLASAGGDLVYYVFDLLFFNGYDLKQLPLRRRKEILRLILPGDPRIKFSDHVEKEGISLFKAAAENDVEGIVAKDSDSPYRPGHRGREWLKIKTHKRQEAVIAGFTAPQGGRKGFGSLILGVYEDNRLTYVGHVGGGFTDERLASLREHLDRLAQRDSSLDPLPKMAAGVTWVEPVLVCEVRFAEWTAEGLMRQPVFLGLREDMDPKEVYRETPQKGFEDATKGALDGEKKAKSYERRAILASMSDSKVPLTHLNKVLWPEEGLTKGDVIDYYRRIAPFILPYLKDRPEALHRFPDGISGEGFYQKNVGSQAPPWVKTTTIHSEKEGKETVFLLCQDEASLVYMANLGCIEINPWHSRVDHLDFPDFVVFDLDPLEIGFGEVVKAALATRDVLLEIGARSYCKTSGATGLHVYVPLGASYTYEQAAQFARLINLLVNTRLPDTTSLVRDPNRRSNRVYLDYLQNRRGQTLAAPYSIRPRKGAPVSAPLLWREVHENLEPDRFNIKNIQDRLRETGDLWGGVLAPGIDMRECLSRLHEMTSG